MDHTEYDTRLAAYAVILDDARERVLLALWNEPVEPLWTLPGGGVDLHETVEDAAVREVREETGYDVALGRLLGVQTLEVPPGRRPARAQRWLRHVHVAFEATVTGGVLAAEVDGTTDEARWFPLTRVPALPRVEQVRRFVG
jgi:8-oxo-dGTP diphosphatase